MDTKARSCVKSIVWRIIGILLLGSIAYAITGNWKEMTIITVLFHTIRVVLYYCHERFWEGVSWGRLRHPLSELPVKEKPTPEDFKIIAEKLKELGYMD
jgi:uncharacterized membrane protein